MPFCAVRTCGESGQFACKKSEGQIISFHRFPSDPHIKAKWIRATDQRKTTPSWRPRKASTICSKHFKKEDFLTCTDLKISAVPITEEKRAFLDGLKKDKKKDSVDNSDTDSADDIIVLPQHNQSITNKEFTEEDEEIPNEYELASTTSAHEQSESNQPIAVQDSEPEFSETSSELEFTELDSSEAKSGQVSVDAIENPQGSDEQPAYGMKISKAYSTRKRRIVEMKDQIKTNIQMYRIDPVTNTVLPVTNITKDSFIIDPAKPPVIIRQIRDKKPIYLIKKSAQSVDGDSQKKRAIQNCFSQVQYANITAKNIAPETGSNSNPIITLMRHSEEQKKVYSTPVPKLVQINQELPAKKADIVKKIWKPTKLNPTTETVQKVKKHRSLKLKSIIKKITPSAYNNMSTAPDDCCGPQLKLALWKSKPTVSRLAPAVLTPTSSVAAPADSLLTPTTSVAPPADSLPTSTVSTPTSTVSTPSPAYSMPTPAESMPTPSPAYSMPTTADSTPSPADSTPTPADSMPTQTPADSTLTPGDSMPTPSDSMPIPADSTPTLADSMLTPGDSMPKPAVLSPAVQKLDDSNIHALDEYDTFAKHVATQLRQLSLESYLSAQGEIQNTLSRYRLCDLKLIQANPNL